MRIVLMVAVALGVGGTVMAQVADRITAAPPRAAAKADVVAAAQADPYASFTRNFSIARDRRGHFQTEVRIDGKQIGVMVDTGASVLALNETTAARIGVRPMRSDYTAPVTTANGTIKAARTRIAMVQVGSLTVRDVDAMVLPDSALSENLLGMSFLSKLKRFEFAGANLVLEQ